MDKKIKVGFVGSGHVHSPMIMNSIKKLPDVFEIAGFCDLREMPDNFWGRRYYDNVERVPLEDMLGDKSIDAMIIETAEWDSLDVALKCAEVGKPFHMDKPAGMDIDKFEKILGIMKRKKLPVSLGYMYRSNSAVRYMLNAVRSGKLGQIHEVNCRMSIQHSKSERELLTKYPCGMMYFLVCHLIDLTYTVMGEPEEIIPTVVSHTVDGITSPDDATVLMRYKNGTCVSHACSLEVAGYSRRECSVCGSNGTIEIKPIEAPTIMRETYKNYPNGYWNYVDVSQYRDRYEIMLCEFAEMVRGEFVNPYSYEHEAKLQRMILAACGFDIDWKKKIEL